MPTLAPVQLQIDCAGALGWDVGVVDNLRRIIDGHGVALQTAYEMGVPIVAGSDAGSCGVPHGLGFLWELELMEQAGMPPIAVLNSATGVSAARLEFCEPIGRLAPRHRARMIFARHDPTRTVTNLHRQRVVVFDGRAIELDGLPDRAGL